MNTGFVEPVTRWKRTDNGDMMAFAPFLRISLPLVNVERYNETLDTMQPMMSRDYETSLRKILKKLIKKLGMVLRELEQKVPTHVEE